MFDHRPVVQFKEGIDGMWGSFNSSSGEVAFLMTRARLGAPGDTDPAVALTTQLAPVREVLDTKLLDFNQLLQRDLDDHRVATELIPYIMEKSGAGPAFFPPILVAALPFQGHLVSDEFPEVERLDRQRTEEFGNTLFQEDRWGSAFRVQRMLDQDGSLLSPLRIGRIGWNPAQCKLVVLDGQHRAMALLAIQRTLTSWKDSTGEKFKYFYERRIERLFEATGGREIAANNLSKIEFPVTILWFPNGHPHLAARKLFVDVNQNARKPSEARLILLSDTELINIFTRDLLNRLRKEDAPFPLRAIEYDQPSERMDRPARWSVFTNLLILRDIVSRTVFGPEKNIKQVNISFIGRPSESGMDESMRARLNLADVLPVEIDEGEGNQPIRLDSLGNKHFPQENREKRALLESQFVSIWGDTILHLLGNFLPWRKHCDALNEQYNNWATDDSVAGLAKDALFEGVGMFWTLRDTSEYWDMECREGRIKDKEPPEIVKAWKAIERDNKHGRARDFSVLRSSYYIGSTDDASIGKVESLYSSVNTFACQIGAALTIATLHDRHPGLSPLETCRVAVNALNAALQGGPAKSRNRLCVLSKSEEKPLNLLSKMEGADAVYFRAMLLELMVTPEAKAIWVGIFDEKEISTLVEDARAFYLDHLIRVRATLLKRTEEKKTTDSARAELARSQMRKELAESLKHWFGLSKAEFATWLERATPVGHDPAEIAAAALAASEEASAEQAAAEASEPAPNAVLPEDDRT